MGGNFDEAKIMWRPKGKRIANMSEIEVKDILNKTFYNLRRELAYEYGNNGYTGTLAEKDSANITILPFLTDSELKKLKGWIINFETIICKNKMNDEEWRKPIGSQGSYYNFDDITHAWNYYILGGQNNYWSSPKIGSYAIEKFQDKIRNCERLWKKTLGKRDKELVKKLEDNRFSLDRQGYGLYLDSDNKGGSAIGLANNNVVYFFGMCSS